MASRVEYSVSMTPIRTIAASGDYDAQDVIANDIGKSLGGSGSVNTGAADHVTVGYGSATKGAPVYKEAVDDAYTVLGADNTAYNMVFIKNTGKLFSSTTELGADPTSAVDVNVWLKVAASPTYKQIAALSAGEAIVLPGFTQKANCGLYVRPASGTDHYAVEYALIV